MSIRSELRVTEWCPKFAWVSSIDAAVETINRPHEDYPDRVQATVSEIERLSKLHLADSIPNLLLLEIHRAVFWDEDFKGQWKEIDVVVSPDHAPRITRVADWMQRLESEYEGVAPGLRDNSPLPRREREDWGYNRGGVFPPASAREGVVRVSGIRDGG